MQINQPIFFIFCHTCFSIQFQNKNSQGLRLSHQSDKWLLLFIVIVGAFKFNWEIIKDLATLCELYTISKTSTTRFHLELDRAATRTEKKERIYWGTLLRIFSYHIRPFIYYWDFATFTISIAMYDCHFFHHFFHF